MTPLQWAIIAAAIVCGLVILGIGYRLGYRDGYQQGMAAMSRVHWMRQTNRDLIMTTDREGDDDDAS